MQINILTSNKQLYKGEADSISLPGVEGQMQILNNHASLFSILDKGDIKVNKDKVISISSGIVQVLNNKVTVLVRGNPDRV